MIYNVIIQQNVEHEGSDGRKWSSVEEISGTIRTIDGLDSLTSLIMECFPNTEVRVTITNTNKEDE